MRTYGVVSYVDDSGEHWVGPDGDGVERFCRLYHTSIHGMAAGDGKWKRVSELEEEGVVLHDCILDANLLVGVIFQLTSEE
jgi:hypothetical protein